MADTAEAEMDAAQLLALVGQLREDFKSAETAASAAKQTLKKQALEVVRRCKTLEAALQQEKDARAAEQATSSSQTAVDVSTDKVSELDAQVRVCAAERDDARAELQQIQRTLTADVQAAQAQAAAVEELLRGTQAQLDEYVSSGAASERRVIELQEELALARLAPSASAEGDAEAASKAKVTAERALDKVRELKAALASKTEVGTAALAEAAQLREKLEQAQQEQEQGKADVAALQEQLDGALAQSAADTDLEADFARLAQKNITLLSDLADANSAKALLEERVASLASSVEERDCQLAAQAEHSAELLAKNEQLSSETTTLQRGASAQQAEKDEAAEREAQLQQALSMVRAEQAQSQKAFETYRERSRASLVETLDKLKLCESALQAARGEAVAGAKAGAERERQLRTSVAAMTSEKDAAIARYEQTQSRILEDIAAERTHITDIRKGLASLRRDLQASADQAELRALEQRQKDEQQAASQDAASASEAASDGAAADLEARLQEQEQTISAASQRERKLLGEMKKKGDLARQLVAAQEKEIEKLRVKLQNALSSTASASAHGAGGGKAAGAASSLSVRFSTPLNAPATPSGAGAGESSSALKSSSSPMSQGHVDTSATAAAEREQYLRQAFYSLFKAEASQDMQHMCRAICAILQLSPDQCLEIGHRVDVLAGAVQQQKTLETLSSNISGVGSSIGSGFSSLTSLWS